MTLLFDLDGTLIDPARGFVNCVRYALSELDMQAPLENSAITRNIGPPLQHGLADIMQTEDPDLIESGVRLFRERYSELGVVENRLYDGVAELLDELTQRGLQAHMVTSKPQVFAERIVEHHGLSDVFSSVHGPTLGTRRHNKVDLMGHVLSSQGLSAEASVMIGDRLYDVAAARAHGVATIGVTWGYGSRAELEQAGADVICDTPDELLSTILSE